MDHLGSAQTASNSIGGVLWREKYTPYGTTLINPASNNNQAGFTGRHCRGLLHLQSFHRNNCLGFAQPITQHIKDSATGLTYMQARYYDPLIGRFLSIDPVKFTDTGNPAMFNRYAYGFNDPVNMIDPDGNFPITCPLCGVSNPSRTAGAVSVHDITKARSVAAQQSVKFPGVDDANDAMRHATTSKILTEELITGEAGAKVLGDLKEMQGQHSENPAGEKNSPTQKKMDLNNNAEGRNAASEGREINPENLVVIETDESGTEQIKPFPIEEPKQ